MKSDPLRELRAVRLLSARHRQAAKELAARRNAAIKAAIDAGHSQTRIAAELDVTRQAVANYERRNGHA